MQGAKPRFYILDLVRGVAVFLMLLAHAVYFFHARDSKFLVGIENIGNTFCFVAFLIVSGATTFVSYLCGEQDSASRYRLQKRLLVLFFSYYLIALFVLTPSLLVANGAGKLKIVFDVLLLRNLPSYTEYIVPFLIYPWLVSVFKPLFRKISGSVLRLIIVSIIFYALGYALYRLPMPAYLLPWKALIAGSDGFYRFPILQYFPVYLLGMYWGSVLSLRESLKEKRKFVLNLSIAFAGALIIIFYLSHYTGWDYAILLKRWPPSIFFLLLGSFLSFSVIYLFYISHRLNKLPIARDFLLLIGQNSFALFWAHIFLLSLYQMMGGARVSSIPVFIFMLMVFWLLCFLLAIVLPFNLKFTLNFIKYSHEETQEYWEKSPLVKFEEELVEGGKSEERVLKKFFFPAADGSLRRRRLIKKRHLILGLIVGTAVAIMVSPLVLDEAKSIMRGKVVVPWWDDSFGYRQNINIANKSLFTNLDVGQSVVLSFDHQSLVKQKMVKADGGDIRLLYFSGSEYQEVDYKLQNSWNRNDTNIVFTLKNKINGEKSDASYFLYYGNYLALVADKNINPPIPSAEYKISLDKITTLALNIKLGARWHLIGKSGSNYIEANVMPSVEISSSTLNYQIIGTTVSGTLIRDADGFSGKIPIAALKPGSYQIQAKISEAGKEYTSQKEAFFVSYPLFVAWTQDWEGYDAGNSYLSAITEIATDYQIPITHFYNPRTTITATISLERKKYLISWLQERINKGDDIALHLHMFNDLVAASGVSVRTEPHWDDGTDGYNLPVTAYSPEELKQIINRSLLEFDATGLPRPDIFRSGGWFADVQTLQAVSEMGFVADSSGRTSYKFGSNNMAGPWNLQATTEPYRPSASDQNTGSINNAINILEIPDNGADSYWFSAADMIGRFRANYNGGALTGMEQVTFLSHPHWFKSIEQQKVRTLLDYISQYKYSSDRGPVVFATSDEIYRAWAGR